MLYCVVRTSASVRIINNTAWRLLCLLLSLLHYYFYGRRGGVTEVPSGYVFRRECRVSLLYVWRRNKKKNCRSARDREKTMVSIKVEENITPTDGEENVESLLSTLVSLDSLNPPWKRKQRISEITALLVSSHRSELCEVRSLQQVTSSSHKMVRLCQVVAQALVLHQVENGEENISIRLAHVICELVLDHIQLYFDDSYCCTTTTTKPNVQHAINLIKIVEKYLNHFVQEQHPLKQQQQLRVKLADIFSSVTNKSLLEGTTIYAPPLVLAHLFNSDGANAEMWKSVDAKKLVSQMKRKEEIFLVTPLLLDQNYLEIMLQLFDKKLLSNPDSAMELIFTFFCCLKKGTESLFAQKELLLSISSSILRQLVRGSNYTTTLLAGRILTSMAVLLYSSSLFNAFIQIILASIDTSVKQQQQQPLISATTPDQRQVIYETLHQIASALLIQSDTISSTSSSSMVLTCLSSLLTTKEQQLTATKEVGCKAIASWYTLSSEDSQGKKDARAFLRAGFLSSSSNTKEFRFRMVPVLLSIPNKQQQLFIRDIFKNEEENVRKSLHSILDLAITSNKNKQNAALDGILAIYLCLQQQRNSLKELVPLPMMKSIFYQEDSFLYTAISLPTSDNTSSTIFQFIPSCVELAFASNDKLVKVTSAIRTLVTCSIYPWSSGNNNIRTKALASIQEILLKSRNSTNIPDMFLNEIYFTVNDLSSQQAKARDTQQRDQTDSSMNNVRYYNEKSVHDLTFLITNELLARSQNPQNHPETTIKSLALALLLVHTSNHDTSLWKNAKQRKTCRQQNALVRLATKWFDTCISSSSHIETLVDIFLSTVGPPCCGPDDDVIISPAIHSGAIRLLKTLGIIVSKEDNDDKDNESSRLFIRILVTQKFPAYLANHVIRSAKALNLFSDDDLALYRCPNGILFISGSTTSSAMAEEQKKKQLSSKYRTEDEEWEEQVRKELEEKRKAKLGHAPTTNHEDTKALTEQQQRRKIIAKVIEQDNPWSLSSICALVSNVDISTGNEMLPELANCVLFSAISSNSCKNIFPFLQTFAQETLRLLASCVYEVDEKCADEMAKCLIACVTNVSFSVTNNTNQPFQDGQIPSSTDGDARTVVALRSANSIASAAMVISEIEHYGECLSGPSFWFIFPIIRAIMTGPRAVPGCGAVLEVLHRHLQLLTAANPMVAKLRKDIALSLLELLSHDRSQTFQDPNPCQCLVCVYEAGAEDHAMGTYSLADLSPLLGEHGALSSKNCRLASMMALCAIFVKDKAIMKGNPIVESRVWINCFDKNDTNVRDAARAAWRAAYSQSCGEGELELPPPSKLYSLPLIPLLSHNDDAIRLMVADAFAYALGLHPDTSVKAILRLCETYIDSFPTVNEAKIKKSTAVSAPAIKSISKVPIVKPKSKPTPSAITMIGSGKPVVRKIVKKTAVVQPIAKQKPVMSQEQLEGQFFGALPKSETVETDNEDKLQVRLGIMNAISSIGKDRSKIELDIEGLRLLVGFLLAFAIADPNNQVCSVARNALVDIVAMHGSSDEAIQYLLPSIEGVLNKGVVEESQLKELPLEKLPRTVAASDSRKEGAVVALGSVALHLSSDTNLDKIDSTVDMLIATLKTPSEDVQASVAESLSKLMKKGRTPERIESLISALISDCLNGSSYAVRRGSAYGISSVVKGSGISCLKKYDVVKQLEVACTSGSPNSKEGSLCAIELLSARLGLLFEPYVIVLLPALLKAFGDSNDYVRNAAGTTAGLIMSKLSSHGVKLVMPAILSAFDEPEWRTKQASIIMLGSMSHLAPKQLASSLPKIVPKLSEAFADTHPKVKASAEQSFNEISKVIRNPEIASLSTVLVRALTDPSNETKGALEALIETEFLHAIDAPSLALIVPVVYRGLRDRSASSKRYAALIAGNMCTMISDPRDLHPYIQTLLPGLQLALLDPIPDVRSTSAKALGSLARGLGEESIPELRPWLIETLKGGVESSVERSGAAQGLTEVLIAGGNQLVETVMLEDIFPSIHHPKATTREGVLWVLTFLPSSLGQAFVPLIDASLPVLLCGLADDHESVRDVALRAGRVLIRCHGKAHCDVILPSLEEGLSDGDWHIRLSSLTLLGDLLSMIGGTKIAKGDADTQEDIRQAERAQAQLALTLGAVTRKRVLSRVYIARSDTVAVVRQMAIQVWKTVVSVTGRTLRDILQTLVSQIVIYLASGDPEQTEVGGRCLGDIVNKLGDAVLPEVVPVLRDSLYRGDVPTRKGACVGLAEVISSSSKEHINKFLDIIIKAVQDALCDEDNGVRKMAAGCFQSLYNLVGPKALDEVLPALLVAMRDDSDEISKERAIHGLIGILSVRSRELLPYLIPRLLSKPMSINHAKALSTISLVTGGTIVVHLSIIIPTLIGELTEFSASCMGNERAREDAIRDCARQICANVDETGINVLVGEIASKCNSDKHLIRKESCWMLGVVPEQRK